MFLRRRKHREPEAYCLDTFPESRAASSQWQSSSVPTEGTGRIASTTLVPNRTTSSASHPVLQHPRPRRPITQALLNKPLPPLPPEAFADMPPEKPPIKPVPDLASHPALRAQTVAASSHHPAFKFPEQPEHAKEPSGVVMESSRHSSTSSELPWTSRRNGMTVLQKKQKKPNMLEDTVELHEKPEMVDRDTQTTPSLEGKRPMLTVLPSPNLPEATPATIRPMNSKAKIWRKSSSEDVLGARTPLWSPRTIIKHSVDYFSSAFAEEDADTEDNIESQFRKYLGRVKPVTPPSPAGRKRAVTATSHTSSADSELKPQVAQRPGILRSAKSEDCSSTPKKAVRYDEVKTRPRPSDMDSAPAVLRTSSGKIPGSPATRPLPLPLQKLTSLSHGPLIRRRVSHHSESGSSAATSPLRQELRSHSDSQATSTNNIQTAMQVAAPVSFKMNRPRAIKLPPRDTPFAPPPGSATPEEVEEAAVLFFARTAYLVDQPDEFGVRVRADQNVPEHLAGSPLCPMHPKHKSGGWGVCPYHGRRKSATDSTTNEERRPSNSSNQSLPTSHHESPRRSSIVPSEPAEARRASVESQNEYYEHRRGALDENPGDHKRLSDASSDYVVGRPKLGRQMSWGAAIDDGAVRGFGFSPSPSASLPTTPAVPASTGLARNRSVIYNTVVKQLRIHDDETEGLSHTGYKHEEQRLASAKHSPYPSPQAEEPPSPPPQKESRATRNASARRGRTMTVKPDVMSRGDRIAVVMDSSESVYRLGRNY